MPCYFDNMVRNYFVCDEYAVNAHIVDLEDSLELRSTLLYDFINSTVYHFGPPSYDCNTPDINKINFETWRQEVYAIMTNDIDLDDMTTIELDKCNMFWAAMEEQNIWDGYIIAGRLQNVFNNSPVSYQRHYIEILEIENNEQPHADNIEFASEDELSDNDYLSESESEEEEDYTPEEALDIINNMYDEEDGVSEAETVIVDSDEEDNLSEAETETEPETDTDTDYEEAANNLIDEDAMNIIHQFIHCATNNDPAALMRVVQTMQNYTQRSNTNAI